LNYSLTDVFCLSDNNFTQIKEEFEKGPILPDTIEQFEELRDKLVDWTDSFTNGREYKYSIETLDFIVKIESLMSQKLQKMNTKTDPQKNLVEEQIDDAQNGKVLKGSPKRTREAISDKSPPTKKQKRAVATRSFTSPKKHQMEIVH